LVSIGKQKTHRELLLAGEVAQRWEQAAIILVGVHQSIQSFAQKSSGIGTHLALPVAMETNDKRPGDRHRHAFKLRLPEIFRTKLQVLKEKTGTPMTKLVQSALKMLLRGFGLWKKKDEKELERQEKSMPGDVEPERAT
jgi:hypothetical protein